MIPEASDFYALLQKIERHAATIAARLDERQAVIEQTESLKQTTSDMKDFVNTIEKESKE